jgi:hypothetical protein
VSILEQPPELEALKSSPGFLLARHALLHWGLLLLVLSLFAAADSWQHLTGWGLASLLAFLTGLVAGFGATTVLHEWGHWLGAKLSGGSYSIPPGPGLFVFDWDFDSNSVGQFFCMSIAGNVGGLLALFYLASAVTTDSTGRAALVAGAFASVLFAAAVEWPVLWRTRQSRKPFQELSKIDPTVLKRAGWIAALGGLLAWVWL